MTIEVSTMVVVGIVVLAAGLVLALPRFRAASGAGKILLLGPIFDAVALAMFSAEHFTAPHDLAPLVPRWLPDPLFWVYFFGAALLAAAISFTIWRWVFRKKRVACGVFIEAWMGMIACRAKPLPTKSPVAMS